MINLNHLEIETCENCWTKPEATCQDCPQEPRHNKPIDSQPMTYQTPDDSPEPIIEACYWAAATLLIGTAIALIIAATIYF